jgi:hypothetical protein
MKRPHQSRGSAATKSADHFNDSSNEPIGTEADTTNGSNGSSVETIDPNETSYFIQYQPELAEKLSQHTSTYSVSGRCLSIVFSRMLYWSRYAKHRYNEKLFYWKNQSEISEETGFSIKQINRALKVLVELGLLIREKFQKHRYYQCYFYHIPTSPHTKELKLPATTRNNTRSRNRTVSSGSDAHQHQQQFHHRSPVVLGAPKPPVRVSSPAALTTTADRSVPASGVVSSASGGRQPAELAPRTIQKPKGFRSMRSDCPIHNSTNSSSIKQSLLSIVQRCESYGKPEIYRERFGLVV